MIRSKWLRGAVVAAACCGVAFPQGRVMAASPQGKKAAKSQAQMATDIALGANGTLSGQFVDAQGKGIDGARVTIHHNGRMVAETMTDTEGRYEVTNLRGGAHELIAGKYVQQARLWTNDTAPPSAKSESVIVAHNGIVRGQDDCCFGMGPDIITLAMLGFGIAGTTLGAIALSEINEINDKLDASP